MWWRRVCSSSSATRGAQPDRDVVRFGQRRLDRRSRRAGESAHPRDRGASVGDRPALLVEHHAGLADEERRRRVHHHARVRLLEGSEVIERLAATAQHHRERLPRLIGRRDPHEANVPTR